MKKSAFLFVLLIIFSASLIVSMSLSVSAETDATGAVYEGLISSSDEIDVGGYGLTADSLNAIYVNLLNTKPELFFVSTTYRYNYTEDGLVTSVLPKYKYTGAELAAAQREYIAYIDGIVAGAAGLSSDIDRVLYLHDYLALNYKYDSAQKNGDAYLMFKSGSGVCVAYTLAFKAACDRLGIECGIAESASMNHIWNTVKIDGEWYHCDVTWDDPGLDVAGRVYHSNFLLSDAAIKTTTTPHTSWKSEQSCTGTKYDAYVWKNVTSPIVRVNGKYYGIDGADFIIYEYNFTTGTRRALYSCNEKWKVMGSAARYVNCYSGMAAYNGALYYNTPTSVCRYDIATGKSEIIASPDCSAGYIYYFTVADNILTFNIQEKDSVRAHHTGYADLKRGCEVFSLTYKNGDEVYSVQYYAAGDKITPPASPTKQGYAFGGWSGMQSVMPAGNTVVTAVFSEKPCEHENTKNVTVTAATCTKDGKSQTVCSDCGEVISEKIIDAAHTKGAWYVAAAATCISDGLRERKCSICGEITDSEVIPSSGIHDFGEWEVITEATEDAAGKRQRVCGVCGHIEEETIPAVGGDTVPPDTGTDTSPAVTESGDVTDNNSGDTQDTPGTTAPTERRGGPSTKLIIIYVAVVGVTGLINGSLIYLIILYSRKKKKK